MATVSLNKHVQLTMIATLTTGVASLAIDGRTVSVSEPIPETGFKGGDAPIVTVGLPRTTERRDVSAAYRREVMEVSVQVYDKFSPRPDDREDAKERLELLTRNVMTVLNAATLFGLPELHVHSHFVDYDSDAEPEEIGGALVRRELLISVPCMVAVGRTFTDA